MTHGPASSCGRCRRPPSPRTTRSSPASNGINLAVTASSTSPTRPRGAPRVPPIYGAAYGLKFSWPKASTFKVGPLEGRGWAEGADGSLAQAPRETWRWRLRIAVPDDVVDEELSAVMARAVAKKGGKLEGSTEAGRVRLERIAPVRLGRILHVGPYADEARSLARLDAAVRAAGLRPARSHLEIYLSDPRRTAAARLKTVLLRENLA